jgi:beta-1,2-mannobiose phosphorylase / 1,2-beta-oligomannan phosphorylase
MRKKMVAETKLLLKPEDFNPSFRDWKVYGVLNPAAIRLPNKKILLYVRVAESVVKKDEGGFNCPMITSKKHFEVHYEKFPKRKIVRKKKKIVYLSDGTCRLPTISHFKRVVLDEAGFNVEKIGNFPSFLGRPRGSEYGVEDARFTKIGRKYLMTYVGVSVHEGVSTYLAESLNVRNWRRRGLIFREQNKDVVIFPEKIAGRYVALHRPETMFEFSKPSIWISYSPDLIYWGREKSILKPRKGTWEEERLGSGPPPLKTKKGWLLIYHGVKQEGDVSTYSVGAALLDLKNPEKVIARTSSKMPLLVPEYDYEKKGFISNVIFPTGLVMDLNGKDLFLYSGGADSVISVRKLVLKDVLDSMEYY